MTLTKRAETVLIDSICISIMRVARVYRCDVTSLFSQYCNIDDHSCLLYDTRCLTRAFLFIVKRWERQTAAQASFPIVHLGV